MPQFEDTASPVRKGEELDVEKLAVFLEKELGNADGPLLVEQFPQGFSNLTYLLRRGEQELVLRRGPFGSQVKSAHDMGREYRVLSKLSKVFEPAPSPLVYCEDNAVLGAPFYVMQRVRGIILRKQLPEGLDPSAETLRRLSLSFIDHLAQLHAVDFEAAGLGDLGRPNGYVSRQVEGWSKRYVSSQTTDVPQMQKLSNWLRDNQPTTSGVALIHNDYKYDNLVLDPEDLPHIIAILDWEMCTLGDPLMDLGSTLAYWIQADDDETYKQFLHGPSELPGSLKRQELADRYSEKTGCDTSDVLFYYVFGLFKLAVIIQQIYFRFAQGHTNDARFRGLDTVVVNLSDRAIQAVDKGEIS